MIAKPRLTALVQSSLIVSDGEKGGAGKSFALRAMADALMANGVDVVGFDADTRNSHLVRFYQNSFPVTRVYLRDQAGWNTLIDSVADINPQAVVLLDLPANVGEMLAAQMPRLQHACDRLNRVIYRLWTIDSEYDSVAQLAASREVVRLKNSIVAMNGLHGQPQDFEIWQTSKIRKAFLEVGGLEISVPAMAPAIRSKISASRCSFAEADNLDLSLSERIDLECWRAASHAAFAPVIDRLRG